MKKLKFEKPNVKVKIGEDNNIEYSIKPLDRGFGITLGNTLRRVLLSSIPGAAIVNVKIEGVEHEFSTLDGVYEDVMGIILNLKQLILSVDSDDADFEQKLELYAEGPMTVTAANFNQVTGVNIINPDLEIANLTDKGILNMEVTVRRGVGYVGAEANKAFTNNERGIIAIDSVYSPVKRVSYKVDKIRGNNDALTMHIETNGAIEGSEVLPVASKMLVDYLNAIVEVSEEVISSDFIQEKEEEPVNEKLDMNIHKLDLTVRLYNSLKRSGIYTVGQVVEQTEEDIMRLRSLGRKSFKELKDKLTEHGLSFANSSTKDDKKISQVEEEE